MKAGGISLRAHLEAHPEFIQEALRLIEVTDVNQACLSLFEADSKEDLLGPLTMVLDAVSRAAMADTILAIDEGKNDIEAESSAMTLKGRGLSLIVKSHIPPAHAAYNRMLVSLIDITARKEAEKRELQGASLLRSIIDNSPDSIFVKDNSLRMVLCNAALARAIGKDPQDTYGKSDIENGWSADLVKGNPEKGIIGWERDDLAALSGKTVEVGDEPTNFEEGIRYYHTVKFPLRSPDGSIVGLVGIGRDVTEKRKAEAELRKAKEFAEKLIATANVMIVGLDRVGRVTIFNETAEQITGYARGEIMNRSWFETVLPKERYPEAWEMFESRAREWNGNTYESAVLTKSGKERYIMWKSSQIRGSDGESEILSFGVDITDRRQMEAKNQLLATLVDSADDAIVGLDLELNVIAWNRGAERLYGYSAEEMIGSPISILVPAELGDEAPALAQRLMRGEQISRFETIRQRRDGSKVNISLSLSPIRDEEGRVVGTAAVGGDITGQKALEAQIHRAQQLEGLATLAGGIAHQFNNIHMVVAGYLGLIRSGAGLSARFASYLEAASAGVQKAVDITSRLLELTEPAAMLPSMVRLDDLARAALEAHQARITEENVQLTLALAETPPVRGDESRLKFVLSSIIGNALDSLLDRPVRTVSVRTGSTTESAYFEVEDSGCGIPEEDLPRIFSPFFSAKGEWARPGSPQARLKGVGLSLAVSSTNVTGYGGRIEVRSTKGEGSAFRVVMPLA
ncbi:MAG: PAS domain S-box protein [Spirochaetia bacterium]|jgi:PAS domain S-box-containing protein